MSQQEKEVIARDIEARAYEKTQEYQKGYHHVWLQTNIVMSSANIKKDDIVLDAGSGTGRITRVIAKKCKKVYAVDFSPKSVDLLRTEAEDQNLNNISCMVGDITKKIQFNEKMDKAISVGVIQHIPISLERHMAVKNIFTYLKSGGIFTMTAYNWNAKMEQKGLQKEGVFDSGISYFRYTPEEIKSLLETCGFEDITVRGYNNFGCYGIFGNNKLANLILYPVAMLDYLISKFDFSARTGTYLVCTGVKKQPCDETAL